MRSSGGHNRNMAGKKTSRAAKTSNVRDLFERGRQLIGETTLDGKGVLEHGLSFVPDRPLWPVNDFDSRLIPDFHPVNQLGVDNTQRGEVQGFPLGTFSRVEDFLE